MGKFAVVTTINPPRLDFVDAVVGLGWELVVVGDSSTPGSWEDVVGCHFLSIARQVELFPTLGSLVPEKTYARKNFGFLFAIQLGATEIWELDDDNFPHSDPSTAVDFSVAQVARHAQWVNYFRIFYPGTEIWPRGFPLGEVRRSLSSDLWVDEVRLAGPPDIVQFCVDGEPDVDAVCRLGNLSYRPPYSAEKSGMLLTLGQHQWSPINTQNTLWTNPSSFGWLYHPFGVSMRYSDIYKMLIAQKFCSVGFGPSTVTQLRNPHNLMADFEEEIEMHQTSPRLVEQLAKLTPSSAVEDVYSNLSSRGLASTRDVSAAAEFSRLVSHAVAGG